MGILVYGLVVRLRLNIVIQLVFLMFWVVGAKTQRLEPMENVGVGPFEVQR